MSPRAHNAITSPFYLFDDLAEWALKPSDLRPLELCRGQESAKDLANNSVAQYNLITPNVSDDMHDGCAPSYNKVAQGDAWLAKYLPQL
jgi:phosphatidylinositol-3-phosphatase